MAVFAFVFGTGSASAKGCGGGAKHHGNPSVTQYIEKIPTACGSKSDRGSSSGGSSSSSSTTLPPTVTTRLANSSQGKVLKQVATSNRYGAPPVSERTTHPQPTHRSALGASVSAVSSGSNRGLIALLVVMGAIALGVAGLAVYRRRPHQ